ncbi:pentatricopeptide repeat-containing protein At4g08210 [Cornus florida]|uniref:pentatricopeptide repeat-containing protein At4g08210 n=1 Tax=Cornus florida TaxID=4283 RepID=UPI002898ACF6|nr:pentatricopeptide repeat-containing protein At4g08210 [Cornus florida]
MDVTRIVTAIRHCGRIRAFKTGKSLHSHLIRHGSLNDVFIANNLIAMYVDFSILNDAQRLFDELLHRTVVTWTTMVSAYTKLGSPHVALRLYTHMLEAQSERPNGFLYSAVLRACGTVGDLEMGRAIHSDISRDEWEYDTVLMNALLDMYLKCGSLSDARKVFDEIVVKNSTSWNTIISGYSKEGDIVEAKNLWQQMPEPDVVSWNSLLAGFANKQSHFALGLVSMMHQKGLKLDVFAVPCALKTCGCLRLLGMGKQVHCYVVKSGFECSCFTLSALIDMYSNCSELDAAVKLFDKYLSCKSSSHDSLSIWNSMLSGYVVNEQHDAAISLVSQIHSSGTHMDSYTLSSSLKICIDLHNLKLGLQVHALVVVCGYELDYVVGSILVDFYARHGNIRDALGLFWRLPKKDVVAWSSLIAGCVNGGSNSFAFWLFKEMIRLDIEVDQFVISSILKACSSLAEHKSGQQIHAFCVKIGYELDQVAVTSLIDLYSKCGEIESGLALFEYVSEKDTVCWTGIIVGCGQNGRAKEAIGFFRKMIKLGLKPNEFTFSGVLSACRHAGLIEEARVILKSMKSEYGLEPQLEHYHCMVDLLGLAGLFKEAMELIAEMPFEPDQTIWGSLLGFCGTHTNTELVDFIAERLIAISPEDPSVYVRLSNIYASLGLWDDSNMVRQAIKEMGIKEAGRSWIEIRN